MGIQRTTPPHTEYTEEEPPRTCSKHRVRFGSIQGHMRDRDPKDLHHRTSKWWLLFREYYQQVIEPYYVQCSIMLHTKKFVM